MLPVHPTAIKQHHRVIYLLLGFILMTATSVVAHRITIILTYRAVDKLQLRNLHQICIGDPKLHEEKWKDHM